MSNLPPYPIWIIFVRWHSLSYKRSFEQRILHFNCICRLLLYRPSKCNLRDFIGAKKKFWDRNILSSTFFYLILQGYLGRKLTNNQIITDFLLLVPLACFSWGDWKNRASKKWIEGSQDYKDCKKKKYCGKRFPCCI